MNRRGLLGFALAAPAIIGTPGLLMPVRPVRPAATTVRVTNPDGTVRTIVVTLSVQPFSGVLPSTWGGRNRFLEYFDGSTAQ